MQLCQLSLEYLYLTKKLFSLGLANIYTEHLPLCLRDYWTIFTLHSAMVLFKPRLLLTLMQLKMDFFPVYTNHSPPPSPTVVLLISLMEFKNISVKVVFLFRY